MGDPRMQRMLCIPCNKHFAYETDGGEAFGCPRCEAAKLERERELRLTAERDRETLLEAIDLKRLVVPR